MKLPTNLAALSLVLGVIVAGLIAGLAWSHDTVPTILTYLAITFVAGGLGNSLPPLPPAA